MPKIEFEYMWRVVLVLALLLGVAAWQVWGEPGRRRDAQRAIDAAVVACDTSWARDFPGRLAEASAAVERLDPGDRAMYQITLDNQLIAHHCK